MSLAKTLEVTVPPLIIPSLSATRLQSGSAPFCSGPVITYKLINPVTYQYGSVPTEPAYEPAAKIAAKLGMGGGPGDMSS